MSTEEKVYRPDAKEKTPSELSAVRYTKADEKQLLRKLDLNLLPTVITLYLLSFLDRSNGVYTHFSGMNTINVHAHDVTDLQWPTLVSKG